MKHRVVPFGSSVELNVLNFFEIDDLHAACDFLQKIHRRNGRLIEFDSSKLEQEMN